MQHPSFLSALVGHEHGLNESGGEDGGGGNSGSNRNGNNGNSSDSTATTTPTAVTKLIQQQAGGSLSPLRQPTTPNAIASRSEPNATGFNDAPAAATPPDQIMADVEKIDGSRSDAGGSGGSN
ncbi:unnamed protein product, partial [Sphacelaria rigidula]